MCAFGFEASLDLTFLFANDILLPNLVFSDLPLE